MDLGRTALELNPHGHLEPESNNLDKVLALVPNGASDAVSDPQTWPSTSLWVSCQTSLNFLRYNMTLGR
jgi:hypothetical protein